jgi:hypothetical protein
MVMNNTINPLYGRSDTIEAIRLYCQEQAEARPDEVEAAPAG